MNPETTGYLKSLFGLKDRVALCTGASSGIGQYIARVLARQFVPGMRRRGNILPALEKGQQIILIGEQNS